MIPRTWIVSNRRDLESSSGPSPCLRNRISQLTTTLASSHQGSFPGPALTGPARPAEAGANPDVDENEEEEEEEVLAAPLVRPLVC